jgi:Ankyrin repeats (3 copies)
LGVCQYLVSKGAVVSHVDKDGNTALKLAAGKGHLNMCEFLLSVDQANINDKDASGETAFFRAVIGGHLDICTLLLEKGAKIHEYSLLGAMHQRSELKRIELCSFLLSKGVDVNVCSQRYFNGKSPLMVGVESNQIEFCSLLLSKGASPNLRTHYDETALNLALPKFQMFKLLVSYGADLSELLQGRSLFIRAIFWRSLDVCVFMISSEGFEVSEEETELMIDTPQVTNRIRRLIKQQPARKVVLPMLSAVLVKRLGRTSPLRVFSNDEMLRSVFTMLVG